MNKKEYGELYRLALEARERAYTPYSGYNVGAALLAKSGKIYLGANIENAAYGDTVCAERVAIFKAVYDGERDFAAIAIAGAKAGETPSVPCPPCGSCRQVMAEFSDGSLDIVLGGDKGIEVHRLDEILPMSFIKSALSGEEENV